MDIMEVTRYILKKSVVCSLHFTLGLYFTPSPQSGVCSLHFYPQSAAWNVQSAVIISICLQSAFYTN